MAAENIIREARVESYAGPDLKISSRPESQAVLVELGACSATVDKTALLTAAQAVCEEEA